MQTASTSDCIHDFLQKYEWDVVKQFVADHAGVKRGTVRGWWNGKTPVGLALLRTRVLLDVAGYDMWEFNKKLTPVVQQFARLIVLDDEFGVDEARTALAYVNVDEVYTVVLRGGTMSGPRHRMLEELIAAREEEITILADLLREQIAQLPIRVGPPPSSAINRRILSGANRAADALEAQPPEEPTPAEPEVSTPQQSTEPSLQPEDLDGSSSEFDAKSVARAVEHAVRLTNCLIAGLEVNENRAQLQSNIKYALGRTLDDTIRALGEIRNMD